MEYSKDRLQTGLMNELKDFGEVMVFKDGYVLTLLMKLNNIKAKNVFEIFNIVTKFFKDKEIIEIAKNDDEYLLLVLKSSK